MTRTNAYSLLCMAIRAIAVWALVKLAIGIPSTMVALRALPDTGEAVRYTLLGDAGLAVAVVLLWLFADKIAKLALVRPQDPVFESTLEPAVWLGLMISGIGAWNAFDGVINLVYELPRWLLYARMPGGLDLSSGFDQVLGNAMASVTQVVLGMACLLRGPGLSRWINRMRYGSHASA